MAASDRKKNIMEHLALTSSNLNFKRSRQGQKSVTSSASPPPPVTPEVPTPPPIPEEAIPPIAEEAKPEEAKPAPPTPSSRKKLIMEHLGRSSDDYSQISNKLTQDSQGRQQKIKNHLRLSQGK